MKIRFWGTRGSIATPGPATVRYGGNTACVEVRSGGTLAVLDCGTGGHALAHALVDTGTARRGHLLLTHMHWDHIQGIPFFSPLYTAGNEWDIYAPRGLRQSLRDALAGQMQYTYFPLSLEQLAATIRYHDLIEGRFALDDLRVTARYLNHPALTLGYRLEVGGVVTVYATDHEPHGRGLAVTGTGPLTGEDERHAEFLAGADLVIHDAQYTAAEYPAHTGWGHSTAEYVVHLAARAGVRRLALFHHAPHRDDAALDRLVEDARRHLAATGATVEVFAAAEGQLLELTPAMAVGGRAPDPAVTAHAAPTAPRERSVLVAVADPAAAAVLAEAVRAERLPLVVAGDADSVLREARGGPALVMLARALGSEDGLAVCRCLRADPATRDVPVVMVADAEDQVDRAAGVEAGVTDWLVKPFKSAYARTRIAAWVLRVACRWQKAPLPADEDDRLHALRGLGILDTEPEERFDRLTRIAAALFNVPIALVTIVDRDRQWFKSAHGCGVRETDREVSVCAHAILGDEVMIVPDALLDERFADNPAVTGDLHVRFYAGYPLAVGPSRPIGTLCLIDHRPRQLDDGSVQLLRDVAQLVLAELGRSQSAAGPPSGSDQAMGSAPPRVRRRGRPRARPRTR